MSTIDDPYVYALGHLYHREVETVLPHWSKEMYFSADAVKALAELKGRAVEPLIQAMDAFAVEMRYSTAVNLGIHPRQQTPFQTRIIDKEIHRRLKEKWPNLCHAPAMALVLIRKDAVESLIKATDTEDWLVRVEAIWALGSIGDVRALPILRKLAKWWNIKEFPEIKNMARKGLRLIESKSKGENG